MREPAKPSGTDGGGPVAAAKAPATGRGLFGRMRRYVIFAVGSSLVMGALGGAVSRAALQAYLAVETFAPWNMLASYYKILTIPSDAATEFPALQPFEPNPDAARVAAEARNQYSLTRHSAYYLRPITAMIDLVLHILSDAGPVGFVFALAELAIGAGLMLLWRRRTRAPGPSDGTFYFYTIWLPLGAIALASVAAIPLWLVAYLGLMVHAAAGLGVQSAATGGVLLWVRDRVVEPALHEGLSKGLEAASEKVKEVVLKPEPK